MKKVLIGLLVLIVIGSALASAVVALTQGPMSSRPASDPTAGEPDPTLVQPPALVPSAETDDPALVKFYGQQLTWAKCDNSGDQCASVEVPLDYADPTGETIKLALLMVPALDQANKIGSLLLNPGGPGAPGTTYAASLPLPTAVTSRYDIVGFDPRGTGSSAPVDCLSDADLTAYFASDPDPDTPAEAAAYDQWAKKLVDGCVAKSGALASHVSTVEAAKDMDVIRAVLGEEKLAYYGASYGTKLGATYAQLFPKKVGRFVLDGALDLTLTAREMSEQQAAGFETALRAYVADCVADGDCYLGATVEEGLRAIQDFLDRTDAQPVPAGDRELTEGSALYGIITPLYKRSYWFLLTDALRAAMEGDGTALQALADLYASRERDGSYADNSMEANYNINCLDDPSAIRPNQVAAQIPRLERASPTFGRFFAWSMTSCRHFTPRAETPQPAGDAVGAGPILVIGTTRDPATPMRWSEGMHQMLTSSILIEREGDGHTGYNQDNDCVDSAVNDYLLSGTVPSTDKLTCPE